LTRTIRALFPKQQAKADPVASAPYSKGQRQKQLKPGINRICIYPKLCGAIEIMSQQASDYWRANIRLVSILLVIWFVVSYGFGIILAEPLNAIRIGGVGLGFWFAQQGSMYTFVALIFYYAIRMNKLDREFDVHED